MMEKDLSPMDDLDDLDDDFGDDPDGLDDDFGDDLGDFEDEDWDGLDDDFEEFEEDVPKKKSEMGRLLVVGLILVIGGAGYFVINSGGESSVEEPAAIDIEQKPQAVNQASFEEHPDDAGADLKQPTAILNFNEGDEENSAQIQEEESGFFGNLSQLDDMERSSRGNRLSDSVSADQYTEEKPNNTEEAASSPLTPMPATLLPTDNSTSIKVANVENTGAPMETFEGAPDKDLMLEMSQARGEMEEKFNDIEDKIDQLLMNFENFGQRITALEEAPVANVARADTTDYQSLSRSIKSLEKKVGLLEKKIDDKKVSTARAVPAPAPEQSRQSSSATRQVSRPSPVTTSMSRSSPSSAASSGQAASAASLSSAPVSSDWVLKSAQPGSALVKNAGSGEMRSIKVGDRLESLGQIVSISLEQGRWAVQGRQGKILQ